MAILKHAAGVENLFAVEPSLPQVQTFKLPEDPQKWAESVTTRLREQFPDVATLPLTVEFRKRDEQTGTAIGAIHVVSMDANKTIFVPFIIKDSSLCPLDIWMESKTQAVHPLHKDTFREEFFSRNMDDGVDARPTDTAGQYFNDPSMWTTTYPPLQGRYSYASAGYPLLDNLSDTFRSEEAADFKKTFIDQPALLLSFEKRGQKEIIQKLAKKTYPNGQDFVASAESLIPRSLASLKKEGPDKYSILSMADGLWDTSDVIKCNREDCLKFLSGISPKPQDVLHDVDMQGEKIIVIKKPSDRGVWLYDDMQEKPVEASKFGQYIVKGRGNLMIEGAVIPNVVTFDGKKTGLKIFRGMNHSSCQKSIAGMLVENGGKLKQLLKPSDIRVGQTGTFVFADSGNVVATVPVTILMNVKHGSYDNGGRELVVKELLSGRKIRIHRQYGDLIKKEPKPTLGQGALTPTQKQEGYSIKLDVHAFVETQPDVYIIPDKMIWLPLEDFSEVTETPKEWLNKEASHHMDNDPVSLLWSGMAFELGGNGLEKKSYDERTLNAVMANLGVPVEKIASIKEEAKKKGRVKIHGTATLIAKIAHQEVIGSDPRFGKLKKLAAMVRKNLIKEAAELGGPDKVQGATVDALLALNFLNPENIAKFVAFQPVFERVADYLAELVLASRLGLKEVPESAAVSAMGKLTEVAEALGKVQASISKPKQRVA